MAANAARSPGGAELGRLAVDAEGGFVLDPGAFRERKIAGRENLKFPYAAGDAAVFGTSTHTITNPGGTFDFIGAYITGGWYGKTAPIMGYLNDVLIYSTSVSAPNGSPTWHQFDWIGIDKLIFPVIVDGGPSPDGNNDDYVVDNFTIDNVNAVSAVPEPSTFVLALVGMLMLGCCRRRRGR